MYYYPLLPTNPHKQHHQKNTFPFFFSLPIKTDKHKRPKQEEIRKRVPSNLTVAGLEKKEVEKNHTHQTIHPAKTAPTTTATAILGLTAPAPFSSSSGGEDGFGRGLPVVALGVGLLLLAVSVSNDEDEEAGPEEGFGRADDGAAGGVVGLGGGLT